MNWKTPRKRKSVPRLFSMIVDPPQDNRFGPVDRDGVKQGGFSVKIERLTLRILSLLLECSPVHLGAGPSSF